MTNAQSSHKKQWKSQFVKEHASALSVHGPCLHSCDSLQFTFLPAVPSLARSSSSYAGSLPTQAGPARVPPQLVMSFAHYPTHSLPHTVAQIFPKRLFHWAGGAHLPCTAPLVCSPSPLCLLLSCVTGWPQRAVTCPCSKSSLTSARQSCLLCSFSFFPWINCTSHCYKELKGWAI